MHKATTMLLRRLGVILGATSIVAGVLAMILIQDESGTAYGAAVVMMSLGGVLTFFGFTDDRYEKLTPPSYASATAMTWGTMLVGVPFVLLDGDYGDIRSVAFAAISVLTGLFLVWLGFVASRLPTYRGT